MQPSQDLVLRRAVASDAPAVLELIRALAAFEKLPPPDDAAEGRLLEHGFGPNPKFETWLAWVSGESKPAGYAIVFETYSTFLAKPSLYLEDLFVRETHRKRGIGKALLNQCIRLAGERGCGRMEWTCLDWNVKAQAVYEGLGARKMPEWLLYRLTEFNTGA